MQLSDPTEAKRPVDGPQQGGGTLLLHQEAYLFALQWDPPKPESAKVLVFLGAAILSELVALGCLEIDAKKRCRFVYQDAPKSEVFDAAIARLAGMKKPIPIFWAVYQLAGMWRPLERIAEELQATGHLGKRDPNGPKYKYNPYPVLDSRDQAARVQVIRDVIQSDRPVEDPRTAELIALAWATGVLRKRLGGSFVRKNRAKLKALRQRSPISAAFSRARTSRFWGNCLQWIVFALLTVSLFT